MQDWPRIGPRWRLGVLLSAALAAPAMAQTGPDVNALPLEQLANVEITSVSKVGEPLSDAAAAVFVISHDDVVQSGATSMGDILRLAPNLQVMQTSPFNYVITARGLNGNSADQNFSDKLLVLIDGRSVYSPLYSGVYWDMQDVPPEDIERIEVISGPGGTLYGANAVNGVVNIVTRNASATEGGVLDLTGGTQESSAGLQYGGKLEDDLAYRVYGRDFYERSFDTSSGAGAHDGWSKPQGGFRLDWTPAADSLSLSGDIYGGAEAQAGASNTIISGGNITGQWQHPLDQGSSLNLLTYYDQTRRNALNGGGFVLNTYDLEIQHNFSLGDWNSIVWGIGDRVDQYGITDRIAPTNSLLFVPNARTLNLANIFAEDHIPLADRVQLVAGLKLENDPYSGLTPMPSFRLSWKPGDNDLIWAAASQVIRSPTPFDTDVVEKLGTVTFLTGNPNFLPEKETAYEVGYRGQIGPRLTLSISGFEDVYDDLKNIELSTVPGAVLGWGNGIQGDVHGVEAWANFQAADWWRLSAGLDLQHDDLKFSPSLARLIGVFQAGDDPHHQASLRSTMKLTDDLSLETDLRDVGELPNPKVTEYAEMNMRLGWRASDTLEFALSGFNLLHARHVEFSPGDEIPRSAYLETRYRF